ncbi:hypothetical protein KMZ68_07445 [Bradyrhizobium sediminis]|uniref:Uncharacterized protein n=1 Tax=Bradyrhizobium sediminis TaxID=2840469 RepID=A0A975NQS8_9BRAD|nr:hypothetical protein [Bradyrhizobium sediminis]QWG19653.1 hypothetical protein KMZ68_07445 [Bradyrhizobium sediminis]
MRSLLTRTLLLAALTSTGATACYARWPEYSGYWVVGNYASRKCEIVTSNPVIDGVVIWFASGPYKSLDDAKLARTTIRECPPEPAASPASN